MMVEALLYMVVIYHCETGECYTEVYEWGLTYEQCDDHWVWNYYPVVACIPQDAD
jgi:hypothetical protein